MGRAQHEPVTGRRPKPFLHLIRDGFRRATEHLVFRNGAAAGNLHEVTRCGVFLAGEMHHAVAEALKRQVRHFVVVERLLVTFGAKVVVQDFRQQHQRIDRLGRCLNHRALRLGGFFRILDDDIAGRGDMNLTGIPAGGGDGLFECGILGLAAFQVVVDHKYQFGPSSSECTTASGLARLDQHRMALR